MARACRMAASGLTRERAGGRAQQRLAVGREGAQLKQRDVIDERAVAVLGVVDGANHPLRDDACGVDRLGRALAMDSDLHLVSGRLRAVRGGEDPAAGDQGAPTEGEAAPRLERHEKLVLPRVVEHLSADDAPSDGGVRRAVDRRQRERGHVATRGGTARAAAPPRGWANTVTHLAWWPQRRPRGGRRGRQWRRLGRRRGGRRRRRRGELAWATVGAVLAKHAMGVLGPGAAVVAVTVGRMLAGVRTADGAARGRWRRGADRDRGGRRCRPPAAATRRGMRTDAAIRAIGTNRAASVLGAGSAIIAVAVVAVLACVEASARRVGGRRRGAGGAGGEVASLLLRDDRARVEEPVDCVAGDAADGVRRGKARHERGHLIGIPLGVLRPDQRGGACDVWARHGGAGDGVGLGGRCGPCSFDARARREDVHACAQHGGRAAG